MSLQSSPDHLLVVDDSPDNVFLIQTIWRKKGTSNEQRWSALAQIEQSHPHLVLLDVMIPGMDGFEVTQRIRQNTNCHLSRFC